MTAGRDRPARVAADAGRAVTALLVAVLTGCTGSDAGADVPASGSAEDAAAAESGWADATGSLPTSAPAHFGFGREADEARVALWDIDVRPDGEGLPPGSGSVAEGRVVYETHCIACHGATGTEGPNDRLVAVEPWDDYPTTRAIGNYWPHATTLYDYIRKAMPQLTPGVLSDDEVYAVIAYLLYRNEIVAVDAVLDAESLPAIVMPARDRFVIDDRTGGAGPVR